jgi:phage tail-like protein
MPSVDHKLSPLLANRFFLDLGGGAGLAAIQEVSGLDAETEVRELMQSTKDGKTIIIKTQGATPVKTGKLTLKYVTFKSDPTAAWREQVTAGKMQAARKNISLILYDLEGVEAVRFNFKNSWPSKRVFSSFSSKSNEPVTVTLTIDHEGVDIKGYNS